MSASAILHLEDSALDAEFVRARLERAGLQCTIDLVSDRKAYEAKLQSQRYDLILSDYQVPTFEGLAALDLARDYQGDIPFIFVSGAMGEEAAVEAIKRGATDYVLKDRIARLPLAIERALAEALEKRVRQDAERRATTILENMGECFIMLDSAWRFTYVNAAAERAMGNHRSQVLGKKYWEYYPEDVNTELEFNLRRVMDDRVTVEFEYHKTLSQRWLSIKVFADPTSSGICVQFRDITEAKLAEQELRENEEWLRLALKGGGMGTWDLDLKTNQLTCSDTCKTNFGRSPSEPFTYEQLATSVHPDDFEDWRRAVETAVTTGEDLVVEYRVRWPDGSVHWVHVRASSIAGKTQQFERLTGVSIDITDRKREKEELAERELRYRLVADAANDAIWDWNLKTNLVVWNEGVGTCFGYSPDQVLASASWWIDRIHPDDVERISHSIHSHIEHGPDQWEGAYQFRRADGDYAFVSDRGRIVRGSKGEPLRMVGSMLDLTQKRLAESELMAAEERFTFVRKSSGVGFWYCDLPFDVLEWDEQVKAHFHLPPDARVTIDLFYERIHPQDREHIRKAIEWSIVGKAHYDVDYRTVDPESGKENWIRAIGRTFYAEDGTPARFDGVTIDVTDRKRADALVADQKRVLEELAKGVPLRDVLEALCQTVETQTGPGSTATILLVDPTNTHLRFAAGERCPPDYAESLRSLQCGPAARSCGTAAFRRETVIVDDIASDPLWANSKDMPLAHGLRACTSTPFFASDGTVIGTFAIYHSSPQPPSTHELRVLDLMARTAGIAVERHKADAELARHLADEKRHGALLERVALASRSMNSVLSADSIARIVSQEARSIIGASVAATTYLNLDGGFQHIVAATNNLDDNSPTKEEDSLDEKLVARVSRDNEPIHIARSLEPARWGRLAVPLIGHGQKNLGVIQLANKEDGDFTLQDEAVLVQLAAIAAIGLENARLYERLREQDRRKDEFLATLAHELRNPLAPVRSGVELLQMQGNEAIDTVNITSMMERQIAHMTRLVDDLLDVSRITRGKVELRKERVDIRDVLSAALEVSQPLIQASRHTLVVTHASEELPLDADLTRLAQVVSNLLNNAAKYTPEGGQIELSTEREGSDAIIRVRDNGVGIPQDMLPKVFELFTQVGRSLDRSQGGLGIGLALVSRLVEMHGGTVTAESDGLNQGSMFLIRLPLATLVNSVESNRQKNLSTVAPTLARRILVVDDNVDAALTLALLLRLGGHTTKTAHNGPDALSAADEFVPEIVFLDIGLPGMNGYEVALHLRNNPALEEVILIALTGWGTDEDRKRAKESGFDHHLTKPVETERVKMILTELSRGRR